MRTVAWAKPPTIVTSIWYGNATQMSADPNNNEPFWFFNSFQIILRGAKGANINTVCFPDILLGSVPDEDWLSMPLDGYSGAWLDVKEINH